MIQILVKRLNYLDSVLIVVTPSGDASNPAEVGAEKIPAAETGQWSAEAGLA
jgi:hypothetical protein